MTNLSLILLCVVALCSHVVVFADHGQRHCYSPQTRQYYVADADFTCCMGYLIGEYELLPSYIAPCPRSHQPFLGMVGVVSAPGGMVVPSGQLARAGVRPLGTQTVTPTLCPPARTPPITPANSDGYLSRYWYLYATTGPAVTSGFNFYYGYYGDMTQDPITAAYTYRMYGDTQYIIQATGASRSNRLSAYYTKYAPGSETGYPCIGGFSAVGVIPQYVQNVLSGFDEYFEFNLMSPDWEACGAKWTKATQLFSPGTPTDEFCYIGTVQISGGVPSVYIYPWQQGRTIVIQPGDQLAGVVAWWKNPL